MDRDRESLRNEIFELDVESQAWIAREIEDHLAESDHMKAWLEEAERRDDEWDDADAIDAGTMLQKGSALVRNSP